MENLTALRAYAAIGSDRGQGRLLDFTRCHEERGSFGEDGTSRPQQVYTKKLIAGAPFGRRCARGISLQNLTCEARVDACADFFGDIGFSNSPPNCMVAMFPDLKLERLAMYVRDPDAWREAVSEYYRIDPDVAKKVPPPCRFPDAPSQSAHVASRKMYFLWYPMYRTSRGKSVVVSSRTYLMCVTTSPPCEGEVRTSRRPHTPRRQKRTRI